MSHSMLFIFGNEVFEPPCRCGRCNTVLPPIHTIDHLCKECYILEMNTIRDAIRDEIKGIFDAKESPKE